jgi:hypothetical protein
VMKILFLVEAVGKKSILSSPCPVDFLKWLAR